jgi:hypothetical protein
MDSRSSSICIEKCSKRRLRKMKGSGRHMRGASSAVSLGKTSRRRASNLAELTIEARQVVQLSAKEYRKKKEPLTTKALGNFKSKPFFHMRQNDYWKSCITAMNSHNSFGVLLPGEYVTKELYAPLLPRNTSR